MLNVTELQPIYSTQKSFYRKAMVSTADNNEKLLFSYDTLVAGFKDGGLSFLTGNDYHLTRTTVKHINEFLSQNLGYSFKLTLAQLRKLQNPNDNVYTLKNI